MEGFAFEELGGGEPHESFLWGKPALLCAQLLCVGQAKGERLTAGNIGDLPVARLAGSGGPAVKPCAEAWLTDRAAEAIRRTGSIPIQSFKGRDAVQAAGLQSVHRGVSAMG